MTTNPCYNIYLEDTRMKVSDCNQFLMATMHPHWRKKKKSIKLRDAVMGLRTPRRIPVLTKILVKKKNEKKDGKEKKREKTKSNFLVLCLLLNWHSSKDQLEPTELAMIKEPIHTCARTHTQTKNRLHSGRTRPTTI